MYDAGRTQTTTRAPKGTTPVLYTRLQPQCACTMQAERRPPHALPKRQHPTSNPTTHRERLWREQESIHHLNPGHARRARSVRATIVTIVARNTRNKCFDRLVPCFDRRQAPAFSRFTLAHLVTTFVSIGRCRVSIAQMLAKPLRVPTIMSNNPNPNITHPAISG